MNNVNTLNILNAKRDKHLKETKNKKTLMPIINNNKGNNLNLKKDKKVFSLTSSSNFYSQDKKVIDKFYNPFIEKKSYNTKLNQNIGEVKKQTRSSALMNHYLLKKKKEIDNVAEDLIIYNNPSKILFIYYYRY